MSKGPYTIAHEKLAAKYLWKAENIVRFFDKPGMTTKEKEKFLASELAHAYENGAMNAALRGYGAQ